MRLKTKMMMAAVLAGSIGCTTSVDGSVNGRSVDAVDAVSIAGSNPNFLEVWLDVFISDFDGLCESFDANTEKSGGTMLALGVSKVNPRSGSSASSPPIGPGTYTIAKKPTDEQLAAGVAGARITAWDAVCERVFNRDESLATEGTITISEVSSKGVKGTFSVTFDGGAMAGKFSAPACDARLWSEESTICNK